MKTVSLPILDQKTSFKIFVRIKVLFLFFVFLFVSSKIGAKDFNGHAQDTAALFVDINEAENLINTSHYINDIINAAWFSLDYTPSKANNSITSSRYLELQRLGVIMPSLSEIISTADNEWHERDTHMGWDYEMYNSDVNLSWAKRKKILVDTINCIFDFSFLDIQLTNKCSNIEISIHPSQFTAIQKILLSNGSKSRSFAAIIYYTHILGDIDNNSLRTSATRINIKALRVDLRKHLDKVFGKRKVDDYKGLCNALENSTNAGEILRYLQGALPGLIENESFFTKSKLKKELTGKQ